MTARRWCCRWMERAAPFVIGAGVLGMIGFVSAHVAVACRCLDVVTYLVTMAASLASYGASLTVGYLGDCFELRRLSERASSHHANESRPVRRWTPRTRRALARFSEAVRSARRRAFRVA